MPQVGDVPRASLRPVQVVTSWTSGCGAEEVDGASSAGVFVKSDSWVLVLMPEEVVRDFVGAWARAGVKFLRVGVLEGVADVDQELA